MNPIPGNCSNCDRTILPNGDTASSFAYLGCCQLKFCIKCVVTLCKNGNCPFCETNHVETNLVGTSKPKQTKISPETKIAEAQAILDKLEPYNLAAIPEYSRLPTFMLVDKTACLWEAVEYEQSVKKGNDIEMTRSIHDGLKYLAKWRQTKITYSKILNKESQKLGKPATN